MKRHPRGCQCFYSFPFPFPFPERPCDFQMFSMGSNMVFPLETFINTRETLLKNIVDKLAFLGWTLGF